MTVIVYATTEEMTATADASTSETTSAIAITNAIAIMSEVVIAIRPTNHQTCLCYDTCQLH